MQRGNFEKIKKRKAKNPFSLVLVPSNAGLRFSNAVLGVHPSVFLYFLIPFLNNKIPERIIIGSNLYANKQCQDDSRSCSEKNFFMFCGSFQAKEHEKSYENFILVN